MSVVDRLGWFDAHLDIAHLEMCGRDLNAPVDDATGPPQPASITLPALSEGNVRCAFATIFAGAGFEGAGGYAYGDVERAHSVAIKQLDTYQRLEDEGRVRIVRTLAELDEEGPLSIALLMEGADPIRDGDDAAWWSQRGVRAIGLAWMFGSVWAGGNARRGPLSAGASDLIAAFDEIGLIHDVSHLADEAADELLARTRGHVIASHSNARALLDPDGQRHLSDELIREVGRREGVIGLNLCSYDFIVLHGRRPAVTEVMDHVEYVAHAMGRRDGVGLGSDMDGGFGADSLPEGIERPSHLEALAHELRRREWSALEIDGFVRENWMRVLRKVVRA